ncbi:MAG TPA: NAD(P)/FAD-dependent oxidoreductase [Ornithinimicrobium sp.]|uniref:FAD-dependent oxidoreductase n=1 Tax=Ornithinimicrobium sp. TaxID=1977084 RepID=UPI002B4945D5|nr:NAD(P)/FAD-dependent oxidoreductase [Ornithinimicrobium sp.]HKJ10928.1 NAD(P)/FAD-dependent oxidoreductase [Ornithinimicrobium sp.]
MDVLIVGAGVAGLTLAGKLLQQGRSVVLVEQAEAFDEAGYSLGIYPLGSGVLHGLGAYEELLERGEVAKTYSVVDAHGDLLQDVDLSSFTGEIGPMVLITRTDLVAILLRAAEGADLRMGTTVTAIDHSDAQRVTATFSDGSSGDFDVLVACDGLRSRTRELVFGEEPDAFDTGWLLWAWWAPMPHWDRAVNLESWGTGRFFGFYPTTDRVMCCVGMPVESFSAASQDLVVAKAFLRDEFASFIASDDRVGTAIDDAERFFEWPMTDARAQEWVKGRVVLCGDSAVGFMPTAGAGANTAMHCAGSLADELSKVNGDIVPLGLKLYEKRCRAIVEKNQKDSRKLSRYIFVDGRAKAWGRDRVMKHYPMAKMIDDIVDAMHTPF